MPLSNRDFAEKLSIGKTMVGNLRKEGWTDEKIETTYGKILEPMKETVPMVHSGWSADISDTDVAIGLHEELHKDDVVPAKKISGVDCECGDSHVIGECKRCGTEVNGELICVCVKCTTPIEPYEYKNKGKAIPYAYKATFTTKEYVPNWKRNGYKSEEEAYEAVIEALRGSKSQNTKGAYITIGDHYFEI